MTKQPFEISKIENDNDLNLAFKLLESVFQAEENTQEAEERNYLVNLIEDYENQIYQINNRNAGFLKNKANNTPAPNNFDRINEDGIFKMFAL